MVTKKNKRNLIIGLIVVILISVVVVLGTGVLQSFTGVGTYEDNQGNIHWLASGIADDVDEGYTFRNLPTEKTNSDGETITPKETATLTISKKESYCTYQTNKIEKSKWIVLPYPKKITFEYYELLASERVALINVRDDSGTTKTIDGTITQTETFYDNGGELKVKSLGIVGTKKDCESGNNVAMMFEGGKTYILSESDLIARFNKIKTFMTFGNLVDVLQTEVPKETNFLSNFNDYTATTNQFKGDVDIGNVQFTIDADQKYYNSFVFTPAKETDPKVSLSVPTEENADGSYSVKAVITNKNSNSGNTVIKATVTQGSIVPSAQNIILSNSKTLNFIVKAPNQDANQEICVTATSIDGTNSDTDCKTTRIKTTPVEGSCGNNVCEDFESFTSCPADCKKDVPVVNKTDLKCAWYQTSFTSIEKDYGNLWWRAYTPFAEPIITESQDCKNATWLNVIFTIGALVILALIISGSIILISKFGGKND